MGLTAANKSLYEQSIQKLFPKGDYWDRQFADAGSDISIFCKVKVLELVRFRSRMADLQNEGNPKTSKETIEDWERVLLGSVSIGLDESQRRMLLLSKQNEALSRNGLQDVAQIFGFIITDIQFPYRPAFFGSSHFGVDTIASPSAWQVIVLNISTQGNHEQIASFETHISNILFANYIPYFTYNGGNL